MNKIICLMAYLCLALIVNANERPNIIFILTDDQRDNSFSGMGHEWVKTPNVDKLLSEGTRFKNAYIAEPTCNPSRAALLLGCHERVNHQGFSSRNKMNQKQWEQSYPYLLRKSGYETAYFGKWHVSVDKKIFDDFFDVYEGHNGHGPFFFKGETGEKTTNRHYTDHTLNYLENVSQEKPFCISLCLATPHGSKIRSMHKVVDEPAHKNPKLKDHAIYGSMYRDFEVDYPLKNSEDPYKHIPQNVMDQAKGRNRTYAYDYDPASNREHIYRYYQMITEIDSMVGEIVAKLEAKKLSDNTIIIFGSDHGLLLGEYGMGGKALVYDLTAKFPCFIYDPQAKKSAKGQVREELVSSLDITTTILDYAGVAKTQYMSGMSLKALVQSKEKVADWRDGIFLENLYTGRDTPLQEAYVQDGWKYVRYFKAAHPYTEEDLSEEGREVVFEQVFNLNKDSAEKINLADQPEVKAKLEQLRQQCISAVADLNRQREQYKTQVIAQ